MRKLQGRAALITGASQGLGKEIAATYLHEGASVFICARSSELLEQTREELGTLGKVASRACDVSNFEQVDKLVDEALAVFPHLDIVVNNAGVQGPKGLIEDINWDDWRTSVEINLFAAVLLAKQLIPHMRKRGYGKFIQLSGGGATAPRPRFSAYAAAKAAVVRFCETLAHEVADDKIDVNCIAPGALNTRMLDEVIEAGPDRVGADVYEQALKQKDSGGAGLDKGAALAVFLAAKESDGITGRLISAQWDPWQDLPGYVNDLAKSDIYTLRRIVPGERGKDWDQKK